MSNGSTFCPLPFRHLFINNGGYLNPCCLTYPQYDDEGGQETLAPRNVNHHSVRAAFRSAYLEEVRRKMRSGAWPVKCLICQKNETAGFKSARQNVLESEDATVGFDDSNVEAETSFIVTSMDLRLGNICNLKCRMCSPFSSAALQGEWMESSNEMLQRHGRFYQEREWTNWSENLEIWRELRGMSEHLETLHFAGGEPLLNRAHVDFLKGLVADGRAASIALSYNTNLSVIPSWLEEQIPHFKKVSLMVSVDGFGAMNEFIRHPSKWSTFVANLNRLDEIAERHAPSVEVSLVTTVQAYNALYLVPLLAFLLGQNWKHVPRVPTANFVSNPSFFSAAILPEDVRRTAIERLAIFTGDSGLALANHRRRLEDFQDNVRKFLEAPTDQDELAQFLKVTRDFDASRGQNYFALAPEMAAFLNGSK